MELGDKDICDVLAGEICRGLSGAESKIWHAHPVWFLDGNPVVGYSKQKPGIRLNAVSLRPNLAADMMRVLEGLPFQ